jgi:hypothetical protein
MKWLQKKEEAHLGVSSFAKNQQVKFWGLWKFSLMFPISGSWITS